MADPTLDYSSAKRPQSRLRSLLPLIASYACLVPGAAVAIFALPPLDAVSDHWIRADHFNTCNDAARIVALGGTLLGILATISGHYWRGTVAIILNFLIFLILPSFIYGVWYFRLLPW